MMFVRNVRMVCNVVYVCMGGMYVCNLPLYVCMYGMCVCPYV